MSSTEKDVVISTDSELTNIEVIVFEDEDGNEMEMEIVDEFEFEGASYAALNELIGLDDDCEEVDIDDLEDSINFFKVVKNGEEEEFELVEDRLLLTKLEDFLEERMLSR